MTLRTAVWSEKIIKGTETYLPSRIIYSKLEYENLRKKFRNSLKEFNEGYPLGIPHNFYQMFFKLETSIDWIMSQ